MSKSQYEDYRKSNKYLYSELKDTCNYNVSLFNPNFKQFHNGINCLNQIPFERSSFDKAMILKEQGCEDSKFQVNCNKLNTWKK